MPTPSPFLDPALLEALLTPLLGDQDTPAVINDLRVLGDPASAAPGQLVHRTPGLAIVPTTSVATGPQGLGNGRIITETVDVVIQATQVAGQDASALAALRTIRTAVFAVLEGYRPDPDHAPLRYQGGSLLAVEAPVYTWTERYSTQRGVPTV